ncbi:response regulator [Hellea sp.]|nr:response regulator [Hellea sp.]
MLNILLIDDDEVEHRLIQRMLQDCYKGPFLLRYADTLEKGLSILKSQAVDVILLDDKLRAGLDAKQSVPALREITGDVAMILISSSIDAAHLRDKTILDVYDIIDKFSLRKRISEGLLAAK